MSKNGLTYCGQIVKDHDPDRYLLSLIMPADTREDLWALFAFHYEIAKTRSLVTEIMLGQIRLQWWRDALEKIYKGETLPEHQTVTALSRAITQHHLPRAELDALIDARSRELEQAACETMEEFLKYARDTSLPLHRLAVRVTGGDPDDSAVETVAVNYALIGLIRAMPFHKNTATLYAPPDVSIETLAGNFVQNPKIKNRFSKAAQKLAALYHDRLEKCRYDPYNTRMIEPIKFKEIRVLWASFL